MPKNKGRPALAGRAWQLLRLVLLCARKGSRLRRRLALALDHLKALCTDHHHHNHHYMLHYGEHELSFGETPTFRVKKNGRLLFPCMDPPMVSFDEDNDEEEEDDDNHNDGASVRSKEECTTDLAEEEEGIDDKAEEFISRFYEEMKLQRVLSCLRYDEMLSRGMS